MVDPVTSVRDLGIFIDTDLVMKTHVQRTVSRCFAVLRQLRQIRHLVPPATLLTLVVTLVLSRPDYDNGVLIGLPAYLLRRLQSVLNASARLICHLRRRIRCCMGQRHATWVRLFVWLTYLVDVVSVQPTLIVWLYHRTNCLQLTTDPLRSPLLKRGTVYRRT